MSYEPNLRYMERTYTGTPYGYGCPTPGKPFQPPGGSLNADSRPQPIQQDRDPGGHGSSRSNARKALELLDWWDRVKEAFNELPGLWRSLAGILATPLRWLRWLLSKHGGLAAITVLCVALVLFALPLVGHTGRDARSAEAEQLLGSARDFCRVEFSKTGDASTVVEALQEEVDRGTFRGKYFGVEARMVAVNSDTARVYAFPASPSDGFAMMEFHWKSGHSRFEWHDFGAKR
jgi:hypothetical protein